MGRAAIIKSGRGVMLRRVASIGPLDHSNGKAEGSRENSGAGKGQEENSGRRAVGRINGGKLGGRGQLMMPIRHSK